MIIWRDALNLCALALVPALVRSLHDRTPNDNALIGGGSLAYFEQRVKAHPHDVAARLDLAYADGPTATGLYDQVQALARALETDGPDPAPTSRCYPLS